MSTRSGTLQAARSSTNSLDTSRISTPWTLLGTAKSLHLVAVTAAFGCGTSKPTSKSRTLLSRTASLLSPSPQTMRLLQPDLSTRVSVSGISNQASWSYVSRVSMATRIVSTLLPLLPRATAWSVAVWIRLSRCGSCQPRTVSFPVILRPANVSEHSRATRYVLTNCFQIAVLTCALGLCAQCRSYAPW